MKFYFANYIKKNKIIFFKLLILILGLTSISFGLKNLIISGVDCQLDAASVLSNHISPYKYYLTNSSNFQFSRFPTHLPQEYFILRLFLIGTEDFNYLIYGLTGISLLFISTVFIKINNSVIISSLILLTTPYRNNIGNGQFLFFYFGIFLIFDHFIRHKNSGLLNRIITIPVLLVLLISKPTIFFWIPFYYQINKRNIFSYTLAIIYQFIIIILFANQTNTLIGDFFTDYYSVLHSHTHLTQSIRSVFFIDFGNTPKFISSFLVITNLSLASYYIFQRIIRKQKIDNSIFLFSILIVSFIVVYHASYDLFLLIIPFIKEGLKSFFFKIIIFSLIVFKLFFIFITDSNIASIMSSIFINLTTLSILTIYQYYPVAIRKK
jgi:hypothetical protein